MSAVEAKEAEALLQKANWISFDSERGSSQSDLCRRQKDGSLSCVKVAMSSMQLSAFMSGKGFICLASPDPAQTAIECRRIAEVPLEEL